MSPTPRGSLRRRRATTHTQRVLYAPPRSYTNVLRGCRNFPANMIQILGTRRQEARRVRKRVESERSAKVKQREFRSIVFSSTCNPVNIRSITLKYVSYVCKVNANVDANNQSVCILTYVKQCASFSLHRHVYN